MIKRFVKCIKEYKKDTIFAALFMIIEVILQVFIPFLMALIIDHGIANEDIDYILQVGFILIICALLSLIFGILSSKYSASASAGFAKNVRKDMYYNIQNYSFSNIDKFSTPSLVTRLTTDVTSVQNTFQIIIRAAVRSPLMLVFSLIMAFNINLRLSFVFLLVLPFFGICLYLITTKAYHIFKNVFKIYDKLNNVVQENLKGIRAVKSYVREDYEIKKFKEVSQKLYKNFSKAEKIIAFHNPLMQLSINICVILISWYGARMIVADTMTIGQLMSLIIYSTQILMALMMLSMIFVMVTFSRASAERIYEVLEEKSNLTNQCNPIFNIEDGSVSFKNVDFGYLDDENKLCLKNINFNIKQGETVGILGGTASSKTSLVQLIPRLYDVKKGEVYVGGKDVRSYDLSTLRSEVAMVLQKNVLFSGTIKENLKWGNKDASDKELERVCKLACAHDFISSFPDGYNTYIEQDGTNISGGQKQRLCIARALLKNPKILILDDSTSAVDTKTESLIKKMLRNELPNTTKFIIAQRIFSVKDADKIIVMHKGKINGIGTHTQLLENNKIYKEIYNSQIKGLE